jgi:HK97 gp10 family phage protein
MSSVNTGALKLALGRAREEILAEARAVVAETAERVRARAYELAPVDTGFMREQIKVRTSPGGYVYEVGYDEADFEAAGLPGYFVFQEFGTSKMPAQPHLFRAAEEGRQFFAREMERRLKAVARRQARARQRRRS